MTSFRALLAPLAVVVGCSATSTPDALPDAVAEVPDASSPEASSPDAAQPCGGADLTNDAKNCGICGRDCLGSTCVKGLCTATKFTKLQSEARYLAQDTGAVYAVTFGGSVVKIDKATQSAKTLATGPVEGVKIALDATHVFWSTRGGGSGGVYKVDKEAKAVVTLAEKVRNVAGLAIDDTDVYFVSGSDATTGSKDVVRRVSKEGKGLTQLIASAGYTMSDIAVDETSVYWNAQGAINSASKSGGSITKIGEGGSYPVDLLMDATRIYSSDEAYFVRVVPKNGGPRSGIDSGKSPHIAIDADHVYTTSDASTLIRASKSSPKDFVNLASFTSKVTAMTVDDKFVYFADSDANVFWVAK